MLDGGAHQLVVGRMKIHHIDALAVAVMGTKLRLVLIGQEAGL